MNIALILLFLVPVFLGLFFFVVGGLFFYSGLRSRQMKRSSRGWPSTSGQVTGAEIQVNTIKFLTRMGGTRTDYRPMIKYEYNVLGIPYQADQITYGTIDADKPHAEAMLAKYPVGSTVTVYYNPQRPAQAVLEHSDTGAVWIVLAGGLGAFLGLCTGCFGVVLLATVINSPK